jgi:hypothetical protein
MSKKIEIDQFYIDALKLGVDAELIFSSKTVSVNNFNITKANQFNLSLFGNFFLKINADQPSPYSEGIYDLLEGYLHLTNNPSEVLYPLFDYDEALNPNDPNTTEEIDLANNSDGFLIYSGSELHGFCKTEIEQYNFLNNRSKKDDRFEIDFLIDLNVYGAATLGCYFRLENVRATFANDADNYYFGHSLHFGLAAQQFPPEVDLSGDENQKAKPKVSKILVTTLKNLKDK